MQQTIKLTFLFISLIGILSVLTMLPAWYYQVDFPFLKNHIIFICILVIVSWQLFALHTSPLDKFQKVKILLIPLSVILIVFQIKYLNQFMVYFDESGFMDIMEHLTFEKQVLVRSYIKTSHLFVGIGAIIASILLPFKLLVSVWREVNNKVKT